jgi:flavin-binding protein dodecin
MGIEKHIKITGTSNISWKDAIVKAVEEVSKTINYLTSVKILDQRAKITLNKITEYYVDLDIGFMIQD